MDKKSLQDKITDFTRFGMVLLAVSVFLFIGTLIPNEGKSMIQTYLMLGTNFILLGAAFYFFQKSVKLKNKLVEMQED
ncbi:YrhC family protein [Bacillus sp. RD4P76]|uniref:YrhC family protein n=2 Tax=Bacillus suaedaesalsae TaxID=2810349 RepID=A0ABS2DMF5_9BACI|nr:YrhC family protein [Bacillus suaedaesalsae]